MGVLSQRKTATVPIPFAEPHEVTVQALPGRHLERAREVANINWQAQLDRKGGIHKQRELLKAFKEDAPKPDAKPEAPEAPNPLAGLDPYTLCRFGVQSLTTGDSLAEEEFEDELAKDEGNPTGKVRAIRLFYFMDEDRLEWFAKEVMRVTSPKLFRTIEEHQESEKNDSAASLTH